MATTRERRRADGSGRERETAEVVATSLRLDVPPFLHPRHDHLTVLGTKD